MGGSVAKCSLAKALDGRFAVDVDAGAVINLCISNCSMTGCLGMCSPILKGGLQAHTRDSSPGQGIYRLGCRGILDRKNGPEPPCSGLATLPEPASIL